MDIQPTPWIGLRNRLEMSVIAIKLEPWVLTRSFDRIFWTLCRFQALFKGSSKKETLMFLRDEWLDRR